MLTKSSLLFVFLFSYMTAFCQDSKPLRVGIAGLTHSHVHGILRRAQDGDIEIVAVAESNRELAERYLNQYKLPLTLIYPTLNEMLDKAKPEAVTAFNSIFEHLEVVKACAPRKIHVMVEKPLAVNTDHARQMKALVEKHHIQLLTNYETTWYGSNDKAIEVIKNFGGLRKIVVHDGHQGPQEIGVNKEFLEWLTDPIQNGGGALIDFGCYGANLITWLMHGERPSAVVAVTQQIKPDVYPKVDDEATIILTYPKTQGIIQASWNWPYSRKDMEVYAEKGSVIADRNGLTSRASAEQTGQYTAVPVRQKPFHDPFAYFASVIRGEVTPDKFDLSSLENNLIVVEILEAARESARQGKRIVLK